MSKRDLVRRIEQTETLRCRLSNGPLLRTETMETSRELAEQAFALLQDALAESDAKRTELEQQLKQVKPSKSQTEQRIDVLAHRLQSAEQELEEWRESSSQLEDILANERAVNKRLESKLETAASEDDKADGKEILFWRNRAEDDQESTRRFQERMAAQKKDLDSQTAKIASLERKLEEAGKPDELTEDALREREQQIEQLSAALESSRQEHSAAAEQGELQVREIQTLNEQLASANETLGDHERLHEVLEEREQTITELSAAIEAMQRERSITEEQEEQHTVEMRELSGQLAQADEAIREQGRLRELLVEREHRITELSAGVEHIRHEHATEAELRAQQGQEIENLQHKLLETEQARATAGQAYGELDSELNEHRAQTQALQQAFDTRQESLDELTERNQDLVLEVETAREHISGLETELRDEKVQAENFNELANERREELSKLNDKYEEAHERYEDAKWQLGKAQHFEKLVRRRKGLIRKLIAAIRARHKASNALKAGIDGLRTYKAGAETKQQELLGRIEKLETSLSETREKLVTIKKSHRASDNKVDEPTEIGKLQNQVNSQAQVIESLEQELKTTRKTVREHENQTERLEKLYEDIETKNTFIGDLQDDIEQKQLLQTKLRKKELELDEITAAYESSKAQAEALNAENEQLRGGTVTSNVSLYHERIRELEKTIEQLSATIKEYEETIFTLNEAVDHWKRKFDFLAADSPIGYDTASKR